MPRLQEIIHALEVGSGVRYLRWIALVLGVATIAVFYDLNEFQNMKNEEAMDAAQVARNIAEGRGFTTRYIRPISMKLVMDRREDRDPLVKGEHPDLMHAPVYPLFLAAFMKIPGLFDHAIVSPKEGLFRRHQPDLLITLINQGLFFFAIVLTWRLARRLFDGRVAMVTALVMLGSDLLWRFSASGLSTMLAMVLLLALVNTLLALDGGWRREPPMGLVPSMLLAALVGFLCAALALTRYSLGVVMLPVIVFMVVSGSRFRALLPVVASVVFLGVMSPWLVRNWQICGNPFGIASYSLVQETSQFTGNWLSRTLDPDVSKVNRDDIVRKAFVGAGELLQEDLPQMGGSWLVAFFLVGLLVPFVDPARKRLRWFTLGTIGVLGLAQILARTHLSSDVPQINSENLLVLVTPLVFMFGAALLALLVYSLDVVVEAWRNVILGAAVVLLWLPLLVTFGPPRNIPLAYPPYYPPTIQRVAHWFEPGELIMTDMPWAVAWYGNRQAVLLTSTPDKEFLDLSDWQKAVNGLYLTRITLDQRFLTDWVLNAVKWGRFIIEILTKGEVPKGFPLRKSPAFMTTFPDHLLLADRIRWQESGPIAPPKSLNSKDAGSAKKPDSEATSKGKTP